jgi:predicted double-glycine peptidase
MSRKMANLLPVKSFQETLHAGMCGPASLKMVLAYYGVEKTEEELAKLCGTDPELGTSEEGIKRAAESLGFKVEVKNNSTFDDIRSWLDKKVPVIVNWFTRGRIDYPDSEVPDGHLSVVVGLDDEYIYLQDPEIGKLRKITRDDFMKVWFDFTGEYINSWTEMIIRQIIAIHR